MNISTAAARRQRRAAAGVPSPWGMFLRGFFKHPVMVGSVVPSSGVLIRKMLAPVDWANTKLFVEYGPGVGTFCRPILERLAPDAKLVAIDRKVAAPPHSSDPPRAKAYGLVERHPGIQQHERHRQRQRQSTVLAA